MPKLTNPSVVEWSILRGVSGFLWSNAIKDGCMTVAVFPLINILHVSSSDDKYATLKIVGSVEVFVCFHKMIFGTIPKKCGIIFSIRKFCQNMSKLTRL